MGNPRIQIALLKGGKFVMIPPDTTNFDQRYEAMLRKQFKRTGKDPLAMIIENTPTRREDVISEVVVNDIKRGHIRSWLPDRNLWGNVLASGRFSTQYFDPVFSPERFEHAIVTFNIGNFKKITSAVYLCTEINGLGVQDEVVTISAYELTQEDWVFDEVTWNIYSTGNNWDTAGGDFDAGSIINTDLILTGPLRDDEFTVDATSIAQASLARGFTTVNILFRINKEQFPLDNNDRELQQFYIRSGNRKITLTIQGVLA